MGAAGVRLRCIGLWAVGSDERCTGLWGSDGRCVRMPAVEVRWEVHPDARGGGQVGGASGCLPHDSSGRSSCLRHSGWSYVRPSPAYGPCISDYRDACVSVHHRPNTMIGIQVMD
jgi:hypothetical protein